MVRENKEITKGKEERKDREGKEERENLESKKKRKRKKKFKKKVVNKKRKLLVGRLAEEATEKANSDVLLTYGITSSHA